MMVSHSATAREREETTRSAHTSWMQHSTHRDGNGLKGLLNDVSSARGPWRRGNSGVTRAMSMGSGLVQQEATHLMLGDYRLVKTLGVGAFGKVQRESSPPEPADALPALSVVPTNARHYLLSGRRHVFRSSLATRKSDYFSPLFFLSLGNAAYHRARNRTGQATLPSSSSPSLSHDRRPLSLVACGCSARIRPNATALPALLETFTLVDCPPTFFFSPLWVMSASHHAKKRQYYTQHAATSTCHAERETCFQSIDQVVCMDTPNSPAICAPAPCFFHDDALSLANEHTSENRKHVE